MVKPGAARTLALLGALAALAEGCDIDRDGVGELRPGFDASESVDDGGPPAIPDVGPPIDTGIPPGDAGFMPADSGGMPCTEGTRCDGSVLFRCTGGVATMLDCPLGCLTTPAPHCGVVHASNVSGSAFADGGDWMLGADVVYDTGACGAPAPAAMPLPIAGGEACVIRVRNMTVPTGVTLTVTGRRPLIILAVGDVRISGEIDGSATLGNPGPGGAPPGVGARAGSGGSSDFYREDGGGGGGGMCGRGGAGGTGGGRAGGAGGGTTSATWDLEPLSGGSGGGTGGAGESAGRGGGGGGAIQITARGSITVAGAIRAGGGGGDGGADGTIGDSNIGAGGGGGSGGAILLEAVTVTVTGELVTTGGGGGGAASCRDYGDAAHGSDGGDSVGPASGGRRGGTCTSDFGATGGASGGGPTPDGAPGGENLLTYANGGGGGGGAGCILIRDRDATPFGGTASPRPPPGLRVITVRID